MKPFKVLFIVFLLPMAPLFAQKQAMFIDSSGNVGINTAKPSATLDVNGSVNINGSLNGVKIYTFNNTQPPYIMKGMAQYFSTLTISFYSNCLNSNGVSASVLYDAAQGKFKIISQAGTGQTNRVEVSSSSKNTLNFYNDCGVTVTLTFTQSGSDVTATLTPCKPDGGNFSQISIISQGF